MNEVMRRLEPLAREPWVRLFVAVLVAIAYYGLVVAGEIGRSGTIVLTALPAALSLIWARSRPLLSLALACGGILMVIAFLVNGSYIQNLTQQSAVLVAIFGATVSR